MTVVDYTDPDYWSVLKSSGPFDVVLDTLNERYRTEFQALLKTSPSSKYVSLRPTILPDTDSQVYIIV